MTVFAAAPDAAHDAVVLTVTGAPPGPVQLSRVDVNGYGDVRRQAGVDTTGSTWNITDWEAALVGPVEYLLLDAAGAAHYVTVDLAPGRPAHRLEASTGQPLPQLRRTHRPSTGGPVEWVTGFDADRELRRSEHQVLERADVVATTYRLGLRAGTLTVRCSSLAAAHEVVQTYGDGQVVLLRQGTHPGLDMHHLGTRTAVRVQPPTAGGARSWDVAVTYLEVLPDAGDALAGWTLDDVDAAFPNLASAALVYATLGDVDEDTRR